jgi:hypothetical protein
MEVTAEFLPQAFADESDAGRWLDENLQKATAFVVWVPNEDHDGVYRVGWFPTLEAV